MNTKEVYSNLCYRDPRNPLFEDLYGEDREEIPAPRIDCACDNCFYGRDRLALEIIRVKDQLRIYEMIKLQPGDYVSTEDMTEEQYHAVCKAFMDAGALGGHRDFEGDMTFIIWDKVDKCLFRPQNKVDYRNHLRTTRELTVPQILNQEAKQ